MSLHIGFTFQKRRKDCFLVERINVYLVFPYLNRKKVRFLFELTQKHIEMDSNLISDLGLEFCVKGVSWTSNFAVLLPWAYPLKPPWNGSGDSSRTNRLWSL